MSRGSVVGTHQWAPDCLAVPAHPHRPGSLQRASGKQRNWQKGWEGSRSGALTIGVEEEEGSTLNFFFLIFLSFLLVHLHVFIEPKPEGERAPQTFFTEVPSPRF